MKLQVGSQAPLFRAESTQGLIDMGDYYELFILRPI
jgi:hypothetical protein